MNDFTEGSETVEVAARRIAPSAEEWQRERMARLRAERDQGRVDATLEALKTAAADGSNMVPAILECARRLHAVRESVFGPYREPAFF